MFKVHISSWCIRLHHFFLSPVIHISYSPHLFFFMMCSKGLKKSFWKRKLASSPFSRNFIESCLRESTAKMATSSLGLQPTCQIRNQTQSDSCFTNWLILEKTFHQQLEGAVTLARFQLNLTAPLGKATDLVEVISDDLPNAWPLQTDAIHVVVGDLHYLLQTEHAWLVSRSQLVHGHPTEPTHKVHWRWSRVYN